MKNLFKILLSILIIRFLSTYIIVNYILDSKYIDKIIIVPSIGNINKLIGNTTIEYGCIDVVYISEKEYYNISGFMGYCGPFMLAKQIESLECGG